MGNGFGREGLIKMSSIEEREKRTCKKGYEREIDCILFYFFKKRTDSDCEKPSRLRLI